MKLLLTTIAAVLVVGCGESQSPELPKAKAPDISISLTGGRMAIRFQAHPGNTYSLHASDDLASGKWIKLDANEFVPKMKIVEFVVSPDDGQGQRFYRVSRTSSSRSGSGSPLSGSRTTSAVPTRARRTYPTPPSMEGGDPAVQALEMMEQKDFAKKKGVLMPPLPFQQQTQPEPPAVYAPDIDIHDAAEGGNLEVVKQHIADGADVNEKDDSEWTPLHNATLNGHKEIAELLIAKGADVNAKDDTDWTPLHHAARWGRKEVAELLIAKGGDVNAKDDDGETPLDVAILREHPETADLLRKHGGKTGEELK